MHIVAAFGLCVVITLATKPRDLVERTLYCITCTAIMTIALFA